MLTGAQIRDWAVVTFSWMSEREAHDVARKLADCCNRKGMRLNEDVRVVAIDEKRLSSPELAVQSAIDNLKSFRPKFVLWILDSKSSQLYAPIKRQFDTVISVPTQCIVRPAKGFNDQYFTNVALKINIKMGHANWMLNDLHVEKPIFGLNNAPTMVFGLDVSHPGFGSAAPSISAVVASLDWPEMTRFGCRVRAQHKRLETISGIVDPSAKRGGMVADLIMAFGDRYRFGPKQIIIFRDGVSESQFSSVGGSELADFRKAFAEVSRRLGVDFNPLVTYIVAQKRNNVRLFDQQGNQNVPPGTVVDKEICHPFFFDFFMCSHKGIMGTSRPVHYHVLLDEIKFSADEIQTLVHSLSYSYGRCTRAVSVVAPIFYAHLAAQRCRTYIESDYGDVASESSGGRGREDVLAPVTPLPEMERPYLETMFYC